MIRCLGLLILAISTTGAEASEAFGRAEELYLAKDFELAALFLQREIRENPGNAAAHFYLANINREKGRLTTALTNIRTAVRLAPNNPRFQFNLANAYYDLGSYPEAIAAYRKYVAAAPKPPNPAVHLNLGMAQLRSRNIPATITAWEEFLRAAPTHLQAGPVRRALVILKRADYKPPEATTSASNMGLPALPTFDWDTESLKKKDRFRRDEDRGMKEDDRTADIEE